MTRLVCRYNWTATLTMWSLSLPQVAATVAAAVVAYDTTDPAGAWLIDEPVLNVVLVLMVVTSILGPILTGRFGHCLTPTVPHQTHG
jgi:hypothetical protein